MRNIYFSKLKLAVAASILMGGMAFSQVYELSNSGNISGNDVSDNGVVVLSNTTGNYMWTEEGGLVTLNEFTNGTNNAGNPAISNDGTVIAATVTNPNNNLNEMALYDVATGTWSYKGGIGGSSDGSASSSWSISGDGQIVVGLGWVNAGTAHAIKWSQATGMVDMGSTVTGRSSRANDANLDGSKIVGWQDAESGFRQAAVWDNGVQTLLYDATGNGVNEAGAISEDGNWVIGGSQEFQAWRWSAATGLELIGHPDAGMWYRGAATAISADGSVIVGFYRGWPGGPYFGEGFIWTEELGRVSLNDYVDSLGIDRQGISFTLPLGMSSDGKMIVGGGLNANDQVVGFLIKLPTEVDECAAVEVPYYQDFNSAVTPEMPECTTVENAGSGNNWHTYTGTDGGFTGTYLRYQWNSSNPANSWFYTQGINLTAGTTYKVTYDYGSESAGTFPESLRVAYGTNNTHTAMTNELAVHEDFVTASEAVTNVVEFTPTTSGVHYFGFNAFSDTNMFYMYLDNIKVELAEEIVEECEWTVTISGPGFGDEVSWELRNADGVIASGGEYEDIGFSEVVTVSSAGPVEFYIEAFGDWSDNEVDYEVKNANGIQAQGSLDGGDDATHSDMNCDDEGEDPTYCEPELDCTDGDVITNVLFQEINNPTDCSPNGYGNYTSMIANVEAGGTYSMSVTVGSGWTYESVMVWIDYNNNMVFEPSEYTFIGSEPGTTNTNDITIPSGTPEGQYRMRVRVGAVNPEFTDLSTLACDEDTVYGETEDYTVNVGTLALPEVSGAEFAVYPNPTSDVVNIKSAQTVEKVQVYNLTGQRVMVASKVANGQVNIQALPAGTYVFKAIFADRSIETFKVIKK